MISSKTKRSASRAAAALRLAANALHRSDSALGAFLRRKKAHLDAPKAITATAHKLVSRAEQGLRDREIADVLLVNAATVARARKRYVEEGLEAAINDRPRPGQERKLDGKQEAHLIAIACSAAPEGHTHWTLQLLADQVVELEFADSISLETVRQMLKKTNSSPGRRRSGVSPR